MIDYRQFARSAHGLSRIAVGYEKWAREGGRKSDDYATKASRLRQDAKWLLESARRRKDNLAEDRVAA